jgi:ferredoxin
MPAMSTLTSTCLRVACGLCLAACPSEPDETIYPACWPLDRSMPKGSVELGTGLVTYKAMPDALELVYGLQGGFHFEVRARMRGLEPGDTIDVLSKLNPLTRFQAFDDTGEPIESNMKPNSCGATLGYPAAGDGDGFWFPPGQVRFPDGVTTGIFDRQYRVVVEIIDAFGGYARDEKLVIAREPPGWNM